MYSPAQCAVRVFVIASLVLCAASFSPAGADDKKMSVAVMTLKNASGITAEEADLITDRLSVELFNTGKVTVMERNQMQEILKEQGFQKSGACTDEACLVEVGQLLGVQNLVSGSIGKLGSMYMINLRVISVTTAAITQVVSKDINGGIEQVATALGPIASQLVSGTGAGEPQPQPTKERRKKEPEPQPQPQPQPTDTQPKPQLIPAPVVNSGQGEDLRAIRNKNRGGLSFTAALSSYKATLTFTDSSTGTTRDFFAVRDSVYAAEENTGSTINRGGHAWRFQFGGIIPAGKYIDIDVGGGMLLFERWYTDDFTGDYGGTYYDYHFKETFSDVAPHVTAGVSFVKRWYPLKINAGLVVDANFNILSYNFNNNATAGIDPYSWSNTNFRFNVSLGPRVGAEILAGQHFGFALDYIYRWDALTTTIYLYEDDPYKYNLNMPGSELVMHANVYF